MSEANNNVEEVSLEERFKNLDHIISAMEAEDVALNQSFELYKEGLSEIKACHEMLDEIEKAMLVMNENGELEEF